VHAVNANFLNRSAILLYFCICYKKVSKRGHAKSFVRCPNLNDATACLLRDVRNAEEESPNILQLTWKGRTTVRIAIHGRLGDVMTSTMTTD